MRHANIQRHRMSAQPQRKGYEKQYLITAQYQF